MNNELTPEQIKNLRTVLYAIFGPYALIMPDEDIQKHRDSLQEKISNLKDINEKSI